MYTNAAEPPDAGTQARFAARGALILGGLLSLASVVFFVAHNWAGMSRWSKFGILELGLLGFAAAAWRDSLVKAADARQRVWEAVQQLQFMTGV